jgi:hypothetical protein
MLMQIRLSYLQKKESEDVCVMVEAETIVLW